MNNSMLRVVPQKRSAPSGKGGCAFSSLRIGQSQTYQVGSHCRLIWVGWRDTADASPLTSKTTPVSYRLEKRKQQDVRMTNKLICNLLKSPAAFVIIASLSSASFAGEFTVHQGNRYRATLSLNSVERFVNNVLIARKFSRIGIF